jgi:hypothetical protein
MSVKMSLQVCNKIKIHCRSDLLAEAPKETYGRTESVALCKDGIRMKDWSGYDQVIKYVSFPVQQETGQNGSHAVAKSTRNTAMTVRDH